MVRALKQIALLMVALALLAGPCVFARGLEEEAAQGAAAFEIQSGDDIVNTEQELIEWCSDHDESGGRVTLGATVVLHSIISRNSEDKIIIYTGPFGLVYDGGCLVPYAFEIIGEGWEVPVLEIINAGLFRTNWIHAVQEMNITATGRNGEGGTALLVSGGDGYAASMDFIQKQGRIRSEGTGAIGVRLATEAELYCFNIEVEGEGSVAVYAEQEAKLQYCKLDAQGEGAAAVAGPGDVLLDTCSASPTPHHARAINRRMLDTIGRSLYLPLKHGGAAYSVRNEYVFLLSGGDEIPTLMQTFWLEWESDPRLVDTSVLGEIIIPAGLLPPFSGLGLEDDFPLELVIEVRDPSIPCISGVTFTEDTTNGTHPYVLFMFWSSYDPDDEDVILWRSDDGGESWYDFTHGDGVEWCGDELNYYYGEITSPILLQLEAGGKESNIASLYPLDDAVGGGIGGDRDFGDRRISGQPGAEDVPGNGDAPGNGGAVGTGVAGFGSVAGGSGDGAGTDDAPEGGEQAAQGAIDAPEHSAAHAQPNDGAAPLGAPKISGKAAPEGAARAGNSRGSTAFASPDRPGGGANASGEAVLSQPDAVPAETAPVPVRFDGIALPVVGALFAASMAAFVWTRMRLHAKKIHP